MKPRTLRTAANAAPALPEGYTWPELHRLVGITLKAGISVLVRGHPGVGKSSLAGTLASELGLPLVDIRLAQRDPADLCGVWFPDPATRTLLSYPPSWAVAAAERPAFVFLDEINAAVSRLHQAAAYQIVLERRVGSVQFHPDTVVMAAGNLDEDNAIVSPLSSALCNRFSHYTLRVDARSWLEWAAAAGVHEAVLSYVALHGEEVLYRNDPGHLAFPSPRSWEMASRVFQAAEEADRRRLVSACVGVEASEKLFAWLKIYRQVDASRIVRKGHAIDFTSRSHSDPSFVYSATYAVASWLRGAEDVTPSQLPHIVRFLRSPGLDAEYAFLFLRQIRHNEALYFRLRRLPDFRVLAGELVGLATSVST